MEIQEISRGKTKKKENGKAQVVILHDGQSITRHCRMKETPAGATIYLGYMLDRDQWTLKALEVESLSLCAQLKRYGINERECKARLMVKYGPLDYVSQVMKEVWRARKIVERQRDMLKSAIEENEIRKRKEFSDRMKAVFAFTAASEMNKKEKV
jgi:hypothetical protein